MNIQYQKKNEKNDNSSYIQKVEGKNKKNIDDNEISRQPKKKTEWKMFPK
jgi:hypothetical protein